MKLSSSKDEHMFMTRNSLSGDFIKLLVHLCADHNKRLRRWGRSLSSWLNWFL